jgi:AraC-like DNA-binding protein
METDPGSCGSSPGTPPVVAHLWVAPGHAVYVGPTLQLNTHVGSVACLALGLDDVFTVDVAGRSVTDVRSALIPPRTPHQIIPVGRSMAFCYLDPATSSVEGCRAQMNEVETYPVAVHHRHEGMLMELAVRKAGNSLVEAVTAGRTVTPKDERIVEAARTMHRRGGIETTAATLAAGAGLSLSRFLHLFVEQTGTGVRCYRRWARMILAAEVLAGGGDLTRAAADAGFATPSHFSAAFRRMFGLTPSQLLATGVEISTPGNDDIAPR